MHNFSHWTCIKCSRGSMYIAQLGCMFHIWDTLGSKIQSFLNMGTCKTWLWRSKICTLGVWISDPIWNPYNFKIHNLDYGSHLKFWPFVIWPALDHSKYRHVRNSDPTQHIMGSTMLFGVYIKVVHPGLTVSNLVLVALLYHTEKISDLVK